MVDFTNFGQAWQKRGDELRRQRREIADAFQQFKKDNPYASLEEFQDYIDDISGGSITISSLGGIGGTNFTPIVFEPQVAILGFSKAEYQLVNYKNKFVKRLILPFTLTYDHRVIDGAEAVKFTSKISSLLSSVRLLRK